MNSKKLLIIILVVIIAGMLWTPFIQLDDRKPFSLGKLPSKENRSNQPLTVASNNEYSTVPDSKSSSIAEPSSSQVPIPTAPIVATVETDKRIYLPSETVTIHGRAFTPQTTITLNITRPCLCGEHDSHQDVWNDLTTDVSGNFVMGYQLSG
ncbi:MAG: hypothetical protein ACFFD8_06545, partial [Candidatus Thorarchaeota archaeon]